MIKRLAAFAVLVVATGTAGLAQYKDIIGRSPSGSGSYDVPRITVKGYLVDKACAYHASNMDGIGKTHLRDCALTSGVLGVIQHGVFYPFDEKGNKKAIELLKKSKLTQGIMVQATGNMDTNAFVVSSIKELKQDDD